jgi:hypothetical protein
MTELINGYEQSHFGRSVFDQYDSPLPARHWDDQLVDPLAMLTAGWPSASGPQMSGIQHLDVRFDQPDQSYFHPQHQSSPNFSHPMSDMGTPSSNGYQEAVEPQPQAIDNLYPNRHLGHMQSPHSSISAASPNQPPFPSPALPSNDKRPQPTHTVSAPDVRVNKAGKYMKNNSDEDDEEYEPNQQPATSSGRGRKRQRIPHTAVERRYRENLNAHLEKLRQTVPSLAGRRGPGGSKVDGGEGVRPSKCEILHGAIEYIGTQDKVMSAKDQRIAELARENAVLKANFEQMQNWIQANTR